MFTHPILLRFLSLVGVLFFCIQLSTAQTYTVTNTADSGPGTLREAINQVNAGLCSIIQFNISPVSLEADTIRILTELPGIQNSVKIDGSTESGYKDTLPAVVIKWDGANLPNINGIVDASFVNPVEVKGVSFYNFSGAGLSLFGINNRIENCNVYNSGSGIQGVNSVIKYCRVYNCGTGIGVRDNCFVEYCKLEMVSRNGISVGGNNNIVQYNEINKFIDETFIDDPATGFTGGIFLGYMNESDNIIRYNKVTNSTIGIQAFTITDIGKRNDIEHNIIENCDFGILVSRNSRFIHVKYNIITSPLREGMLITKGSHDNVIEFNKIFNCKDGIVFGNGVVNNRFINNKIYNNANIAIKINSVAVTDNYFAGNFIWNNDSSGVYLDGNSNVNNVFKGNYIGLDTNLTVKGNLIGIYSNAPLTQIGSLDSANIIKGNVQNGILLGSSASQNSIIGNTISLNGGNGVEVQSNGNTIYGNKIGLLNEPNAGHGLLISGNGNNASNEIHPNTYFENGEDGILISGQGNSASYGSMFTKPGKKAVHLFNNGNINKEKPQIVSHSMAGSNIVLNGVCQFGDTILIYQGEEGEQRAIKYLNKVIATDTEWQMNIPLNSLEPGGDYVYFIAQGIDNSGRSSELSDVYKSICLTCSCSVTNTNDSGPGSLREGINSVNQGACSTLQFNISPLSLVADTIKVLSPLPKFKTSITIDGTTESGYTDNMPAVVVKWDGGPEPTNCFQDTINVQTFVTIKGISFSNFNGICIQTGSGYSKNKIANCNFYLSSTAVVTSNAEVRNCRIENCESGITAWDSCIVEYCKIKYVKYIGIGIARDNNIIQYNEIDRFGDPNLSTDEPTGGFLGGIFLGYIGGGNNNIKFNTITNSEIGIQVFNMTNAGKENHVENNNILDCAHGILLSRDTRYTNVKYNTVKNSLRAGIRLDRNVLENKISNNKIYEGKDGIILTILSKNNQFLENKIFNNTNIGIKIPISPDNSGNYFAGNYIWNNDSSGVYLDGNSNVNNIFKSNYIGLDTNHTVKGNLIGIYSNAPLSQIGSLDSANIIKGNVQNGILLGSNASQNSIVGNTISLNGDNGIEVKSNGNTIYGNKIGLLNEPNAGHGLLISGNGNNASNETHPNTYFENGEDGILISGQGNSASYGTMLTKPGKKAVHLFNNGNINKEKPQIVSHEVVQSDLLLKGTCQIDDTIILYQSDGVEQRAVKYLTKVIANGNEWQVYIPNSLLLPNYDYVDFIVQGIDNGGRSSELSDIYRAVCLSCPCIVTNTDDNGPGSFRAAVQCASIKPFYSSIQFDIPGDDAKTISLNSEIIFLNKYGINIDAEEENIIIKNGRLSINVSNHRFANLKFDETTLQFFLSDSCIVEGNTFSNKTDEYGPLRFLYGGNHNVIRKNIFGGVERAILFYSGVPSFNYSNNLIEENYIGVTPDGDSLGVTIGGIIFNNTRGSGNVIRNNVIGYLQNKYDYDFLSYVGLPAAIAGIMVGDTVQNNYIGVLPSGKAAPVYSTGMFLYGNFNTVISDNRIENCDTAVVFRYNLNDYYTFVLPADNGQNNKFINNHLNNNKYGVSVNTISNILFSQNSITNTILGDKSINLIYGGNNNKSAPVLSGNSGNGNSIMIAGSSEPNDKVEIFTSNASGKDATSYVGSVIADADGKWSGVFNIGSELPVQPSYFFTATATDANNNTSELASTTYYCNEHLKALPASVSVCSKDSLKMDASVAATEYEWIYNNKVVGTSDQYWVKNAGVYILKVKDESNCIARDTVEVKVATSPLLSDFLMATNAGKNDQVVVVDINFGFPDSLAWDFGAAQVKEENQMYLLTFDQIGIYEVKLTSYLGTCSQTTSHFINIGEESMSTDNGYIYPYLIKEATLGPNPNTGTFTITTSLTQEENIQIEIYNSMGKLIQTRKSSKASIYHELAFHWPELDSGKYIIKVTCGKDIRILKMIKE